MTSLIPENGVGHNSYGLIEGVSIVERKIRFNSQSCQSL
jgi:hypothetical protein